MFFYPDSPSRDVFVLGSVYLVFLSIFIVIFFFKEKLRQSQSEKDDVEKRCKRLMQAMAVAAEVS